MRLSNGVRMHDGARALAEILEKFLEGRRVDVRPTRASILWDFFSPVLRKTLNMLSDAWSRGMVALAGWMWLIAVASFAMALIGDFTVMFVSNAIMLGSISVPLEGSTGSSLAVSPRTASTKNCNLSFNSGRRGENALSSRAAFSIFSADSASKTAPRLEAAPLSE